MILKSIAIDDEILALNKIKRFIAKTNFIELVHTFDNAADALAFLKNNEMDLLFLDIEMPEISGFQLLEKLNQKPYVILTTAFDQYALKSYDFEVNDYLLKPIQFDRFLKAAEKVYEMVKKDKKISTLPINEEPEKEHIHVKSSGKIIKIFIDDILFIEGMKDYLSIHTNDKRVLTLMSFDQLISKLPDYFIRVHKSFVVSVNKINEYNSSEIEVGNTTIPVSRTYKHDFMEVMKNKIR